MRVHPPDLDIEIKRGTIYRESGTVRNHEIYQSRYLATMQLPASITRVNGFLRYSRWQTEMIYSPRLSQSSNLTWFTDQLVLGVRGAVARDRLDYKGTIGVGRVTSQNRLIGSLDLDLRLRTYIAVTLEGGREVSPIQLGNIFEVQNYPLNTELSDVWYGLGGRLNLTDNLEVSGQVKYGDSEYISSMDERDYRTLPAIQMRGDKISVVYTSPQKSTIGIVYTYRASSGRSPLQYSGTGAGLFTTLKLQEDLIQLYGQRRDGAGRSWQLDYSRLTTRYEARGHLESWPIAESFIAQALYLYFRGTGDWASDRLRLAVEGAGNSWAFAANYVWITPNMDGWWQLRNIIFFVGDKHIYDLTLKRTELLALEGVRAFQIGKRFRLVYTLKQALPVKVVRQPGTEPPPSLKKGHRISGGTFHMIKLELNFR